MSELSNSNWSEVDANNTAASPNGWPSGTFPNQVEGIGQATMGAIKRFWDRINGTVSSTGSANAYVYTPTNVSFPTAFVTGEKFTFKANFANSGASTLALNGLAAKNIFKQSVTGPTALTGNEIQNGQFVTVAYDGTQFQIISAVPPTAVGTVPAFSAYLSSDQSVSDSTLTKIQFNTEEFDTNSNYDNATNYRFTPTVSGYYQVNAYMQTNTSPTTGLLSIYKNGSQFKDLINLNVSTYVTGGGSTLINMNGSTDYLEVYGYLAGASQKFLGSQKATNFSACLVKS